VAASPGAVELRGDGVIVWALVLPHEKREGERKERPVSIG
jgi:hypothetical protein